MDATTVAVDLAKDVFEVATANRVGRILERKRLTRRQFLLVFGAGIAVGLAGAFGPLLAGQIDPFGLVKALALNTMVATVVSYGYRRAIERELDA